jgi:tRNA (adenine37-N6)-methyltransferase
MDIVLQPVGQVHSAEKGPREDDWGGIVSEIRLSERFGPEALQGLAEFSHVEVLFYFHRVSEESVVTGVRHPRGNASWPKTGIFAQRGKNRPNRIGATICRLLAVDGTVVKVEGLDALDGTPVLDIKPVMQEFLPDRPSVRQPKWVDELMGKYFSR